MTISSETSKVTYAANGSTTVFPFTFKILDETHLLVETVNDNTGVVTTLTIGTNYTVSGTGNSTGQTNYTSGDVTALVAPASGNTVVVRRSVPNTQETDYVENADFPADSHERALDKLTMIEQEQSELLERCVNFPASISGLNTTIEAGSIVPLQYIRVNAAGTGLDTVSTLAGNIVEDTTPQLGGNLDQNGFYILNLKTAYSGDTTKQFWVDCSSATTGTKTTIMSSQGADRVITLPDATTTLVGTDTTQTLTNKTLTAPVLGTPASGTLTSCTGLPLTTGVTGTLPVANGGTGITSFGAGVATWLGTPSSANLAASLTDETGSGSAVFATSPTLVTPLLGTPTSGTLTNCTGLPVSTGVSGLGAGVATFLGTPSSANLASAVTDETGSGSLVFGTSPTLTTPKIAQINDTNGNAALLITAGAGGNYFNITGMDTSTPILRVEGVDTNITLRLTGKGNGGTRILDSSDNTKFVAFSQGGSTAGTYTDLVFSQTANRTITLPNATGTLATQSTGTWTPVLTCPTVGDLSVTYSRQVGTYTLTSNSYTISCSLITSAFTHTTASGALRITGIPAASVNISGNVHTAAFFFSGVTKAGYTQFTPELPANSSTIDFIASGTGTSLAQVNITDLPTGGSVQIFFTMTYRWA
jgi:hypothetical protein